LSLLLHHTTNMNSLLLILLLVPCLVLANSCTTTLYANDFMWAGVRLLDGKPNIIVQNYETKNQGSDLIFNTYSPGNITIGPEGANQGGFVDLGTEADLRTKYQIQGLSTGTTYFSIRYTDNQKKVLGLAQSKNPDNSLKWIPFDTNQLQPLFQPRSTPSFLPIINHIYLIRIIDPNSAKFERVAKIHVVSYEPGEDYVTIRWDVLKETEVTDEEKLLCMVAASTISADANAMSSPLEVEEEVPGWVAGTVVVLFLLVGALLVGFGYVFLRIRRFGYINATA